MVQNIDFMTQIRLQVVNVNGQVLYSDMLLDNIGLTRLRPINPVSPDLRSFLDVPYP